MYAYVPYIEAVDSKKNVPLIYRAGIMPYLYTEQLAEVTLGKYSFYCSSLANSYRISNHCRQGKYPVKRNSFSEWSNWLVFSEHQLDIDRSLGYHFKRYWESCGKPWLPSVGMITNIQHHQAFDESKEYLFDPVIGIPEVNTGSGVALPHFYDVHFVQTALPNQVKRMWLHDAIYYKGKLEPVECDPSDLKAQLAMHMLANIEL